MQNFTTLVTWILGPIPLIALMLAILVMIWAGGRLRRRQVLTGDLKGLGAVDAAIFSLMSLLIAFTFSGAAQRFDARRQLIIEETNAIGTAYLRLDLLAEGPRAALQGRFRQYADERIASYRAVPDMPQVEEHLARSVALQNEIWNGAVKAAAETGGTPATMLLLPALNEMIDITTTRLAATEMHPPAAIYVMLIALTLVGAMLVGYGMGANTVRSWPHILGFAVLLSLAIYVIVDLEYPRLGLVQVSGFDHYLEDVRQSMK